MSLVGVVGKAIDATLPDACEPGNFPAGRKHLGIALSFELA
jgi:hypothetical protein